MGPAQLSPAGAAKRTRPQTDVCFSPGFSASPRLRVESKTKGEEYMSRRFYEKDGNLDYLNGRAVAIIGYGRQRRAPRVWGARGVSGGGGGGGKKEGEPRARGGGRARQKFFPPGGAREGSQC